MKNSNVPHGSFDISQAIMSSRNTTYRNKSTTLNSTTNQFKRSTILENLIFTPDDQMISTRALEKQYSPEIDTFDKLRE